MSENTRKQFEAWISAMPYERKIGRIPKDDSRYAWPGQYFDHEVQLALEAWCEALKLPCITRLSASTDNHPFVAYLRDGTKIGIARAPKTVGAAWLLVEKQSVIKPA